MNALGAGQVGIAVEQVDVGGRAQQGEMGALTVHVHEKIADFAVGIAHEAIFHVEGEVTRHNDLNAYYESLNGGGRLNQSAV